jgi:hypothetical protein
VTIVITTTPSTPSAATMAIIAIDVVVVVLSLSECFMLEIYKELILLRVSAIIAL